MSEPQLQSMARALSKIAQSAEVVAARMKVLAVQMRVLGLALRNPNAQGRAAHELLQRRRRFGGMSTDARLYPERWQSTVCAGLLCSITPCPSERYDLHCSHTCHRRRRT